ncbi:hypothetical protein CVT24_003006 [Panaeolus cyanescens]|uniref:Metallo-beta-lactamase domain-containing protein n=1 Tax=Panaeolus cyanescens TaxID=181874 RepID=A0A409VFU7_9AGAR|nr:hypothetical protein CVT24_003006 [Panaeolus cyanescens]
MSELVIRESSTCYFKIQRPFSRFGIWPIGGRSTAVQLKGGDLWVLASTPLDTETKSKLDELGAVKYIIGADAVHHLYLTDFKKAYPTAKLIAPKDAISRHGDKSLVFDGVWGQDPPDTKYGFEDEYSKTNKSPSFLGIGGFGPSSWFHSKLTSNMGVDNEAMRRDAKTVDSWNFDRIIPCHGDVIEHNAKQAWRDAYKFFLN